MWSSYEAVFIDSPPGAGRGVALALKSSDIALLVAEPTKLGLADLSRVHKLAKSSAVREVVVLNKHGLPGGTRADRGVRRQRGAGPA